LVENALILGDFDYVPFDVTGALKFAQALYKIYIAMGLCKNNCNLLIEINKIQKLIIIH
jgi:hypothetical protein